MEFNKNKTNLVETIMIIAFLFGCVFLKIYYQTKMNVLNSSDALKIIETKYNEVINLYYIGNDYKINNNYKIINEKKYNEIINFDEITNNIFTGKGKKQYYENNNIVLNDNQKFYKLNKIEDNCSKYENKFNKIKITNNEIIYNIESKCLDDDKSKVGSLTLKLIQNDWFVDNFEMNLNSEYNK